MPFLLSRCSCLYIFDYWGRVKERKSIFILTIMLLCLNKELLKTFLSSQICPYLGGKEIPQIGVYFSLLILSFPYFRFSRAREKTTSPQYTQKRKKKKKKQYSIFYSFTFHPNPFSQMHPKGWISPLVSRIYIYLCLWQCLFV